MEFIMPGTSLIVLCGVAGCGKSTFASKNFKDTEIVSSDRCRAIVSDDEGSMEASRDAFELFYLIIKKRMGNKKLIVADSTALTHSARKKLLKIGRDNNYHVALIAFDIPLQKSLERNNNRSRRIDEEVIKKQYEAFKKSLAVIESEGFDQVVLLNEQDAEDFTLNVLPEAASGLLKPMSYTASDGYKVKFGYEEVKYAIDFLNSKGEIFPWIIYVPPAIPSPCSGPLDKQVECAFRYYVERGIDKFSCETRMSEYTCIVTVCKDKDYSSRYFRSEKYGEIYSIYRKLPVNEYEKNGIINKLHDDFKNSGYFEKYNTEFVTFEAQIHKDDINAFIIPVKLICHSYASMLYNESASRGGNIDTLCECSDLLKRNDGLIYGNEACVRDGIIEASNQGYKSFLIRPWKSQTSYKGHMLQPEILCSSKPAYSGEECFRLSSLAYELSAAGINRFIRKKLSNKYFEYIIACILLNRKMFEIGEW